MSKPVSLCVIRIEMEDENRERSPSENDSSSDNQDVRPPQQITVETYASAAMDHQELHLLRGSHEGSTSPIDKKMLKENKDFNDAEELDFFFGNPLVEVTKGILHLYKENEVTDASAEAPSNMLCLIAVPATVNCRDLLSFTAACQRDIQHVRILRDSSPHKYMALLTFRSRGAAYEFRDTFGGTAYSSLEPSGICHPVWVRRVECFSGAAPPPASATELPTCPVCLERMDESVEGILTVQCAHAFHATCLSGWTDGSCPVCRCAQSPDPPAASVCVKCADEGGDDKVVEGAALWICLICGHIGCGRYQAGHAANHFRATNHTYALQLGTNRVWDYAGDNFVHRLLQNKTDGKLVAAGGPADPETCGVAAEQEKVDSIQLEYAYLLTTQLDTQRRHYEEIISKQKESITGELKSLQDKLHDAEKQRNQLTKKVQGLTTKLAAIQTELNEEKLIAKANAAAREELTAKSRAADAEISELRDQIRDLTFYLEASTAIGNQTDFKELQGGQVVVPNEQQPKHKKGRGKRS